jgi:glucose/arabinose dehydrogenase
MVMRVQRFASQGSIGHAVAIVVLAAAIASSIHAQSLPPADQGPARVKEGEQPLPTEPPPTRFIYPTRGGVFIPLPKVPPVYDTTAYKIRVVTVVNGLSRPFSLAFLPDGSALVTERTGHLRRIVNGALDPMPISGVPEVISRAFDGLQDIALHPQFAENHLVYLSYTKPGPDHGTGIALARGRLEGHELKDVKDIYFVGEWTKPGGAGSLGARLVFDRQGFLYMTIGCCSPGKDQEAQNPASALGKVIRLRDDGTVPPDNPFVGKAGYRPEIFTMGHRNALGLAINPATGDIWENENGPQGGDEINILKAGKNYGWPVASEGRDYGGTLFPTHAEVPGMERPFMIWVPAIAISGMMFYTADTFPNWKGNVFVGSLSYNHLERLTFNKKWEPTYGREWLLIDLKQRIRDVRQGPDGNVYLLTDAAYGALLRIERADK